MKNMTLECMAAACKGQLYNGDDKQGLEASGVVIDSRQVEAGYVFIATRGERVDGHSYIDQVMEQGAMGVICEKPPATEGYPYILVEDSFLALKQVATYYRMQLEIPMIAIVGSVGKTSTKEMVATVLEEQYCVHKTQGNYNNEIGLPLTILQIRKEHEVAVLELGINQFGEMDRLGAIAKPDYVIMTNIGQCHLEFLESQAGILQAKSEILAHVVQGGTVFINGDDPYLSSIEPTSSYTICSYGRGNHNRVYDKGVSSLGLRGSNGTFVIGEQLLEVWIPIPGEHTVYNALAATAIGTTMGLSLEQIPAGIARAKTIGGRSHLLFEEKRIIIDDCYNANPVSMKAAIELLCLSNTRKVAILGDMGELGEEKIAMHQEVGRFVAQSQVDMCICIGTLSKYMAEAVSRNDSESCKVLWFHTVESLLEELGDHIEEEDTILIKASHAMEFHKIVERLTTKHL